MRTIIERRLNNTGWAKARWRENRNLLFHSLEQRRKQQSNLPFASGFECPIFLCFRSCYLAS